MYIRQYLLLTGQLEASLGKDRFLARVPGVQRVCFAVSHWCDELFDKGLEALRPVAMTVKVLEDLLLAQKI